MCDPKLERPTITKLGNKILHDGKEARFVITSNWIMVSCSDITPDALKFIYEQWKNQYGQPNVVVLQEGSKE